MTRSVFLLRGVNVGGAHRLPMADLRRIATDLGHDEVATHLQSGNLVSLPPDGPDAAAAALADRLGRELGFAVPVLVRTHEELAAAAADDPFDGRATDPARHAIHFSATPIPADALDGADLADHAPDELAVRDREVHLWTPGGQHASRLARLVARRLPDVTARNRRTVVALAERSA